MREGCASRELLRPRHPRRAAKCNRYLQRVGLRGLPDSGFFGPKQRELSTPATDIFNLGSILYTVLTGQWPYKAPRECKAIEKIYEYSRKVDTLFSLKNLPMWESYLVDNCPRLLEFFCNANFAWFEDRNANR